MHKAAGLLQLGAKGEPHTTEVGRSLLDSHAEKVKERFRFIRELCQEYFLLFGEVRGRTAVCPCKKGSLLWLPFLYSLVSAIWRGSSRTTPTGFYRAHCERSNPNSAANCSSFRSKAFVTSGGPGQNGSANSLPLTARGAE